MSDAAQKTLWPQMAPHLTKGKTLYFSHGFSVVYKDQTNLIPPKDIDVILVAPKGYLIYFLIYYDHLRVKIFFIINICYLY